MGEFIIILRTSNDWWLFIDSSITSLKAALMYKNNLLPVIPITHVNVKEARSSIEKILELIKYHSHGWCIICDLKVLNFIMCLKSVYAKYHWFYCKFDSRQSTLYFNPTHIMPTCVDFDINPLVPVEKITLPVLHIKLGLLKKYVKSLDKENDCFKFIYKIGAGSFTADFNNYTIYTTLQVLLSEKNIANSHMVFEVSSNYL